MKHKKLVKDIIYAFLSQFISLGLSIILSLVIPKLLNLEQYGYWQLFLFYTSYVGLFHFGFIDGIYLRMGGEKYSEIDFNILGAELRVFTTTQIIISVIVIIFAFGGVDNDRYRLFVLIMTSLYLPLTNITNYFGYIFQATNRTKIFSFNFLRV